VQNLDLRSTVQLSEGVDDKGSVGRTSKQGMCVGGGALGPADTQFLSCKAKAEFPSVSQLNIHMTVCIYSEHQWMEYSTPVSGGDQSYT
jgi:hypothetical protein